ncbi:hypothetical protein IQ270_19105 [Microcoleus sp. LEGE 07076]|uniref:hypothetical protein n=1 Tax=Microcoleus sp. LEGE 07076 TaxID=915322 RepID=UPI00187E135D|nr:hypothetical protein [Microcoleus sp. LEGE 07076]MBE9186735.1 hypothetical protein [Microcoleus sp. LEGE 07076]
MVGILLYRATKINDRHPKTYQKVSSLVMVSNPGVAFAGLLAFYGEFWEISCLNGKI